MKLFKTPFSTNITYCHESSVTVDRSNCFYSITPDALAPIKVIKCEYDRVTAEKLDDGTFKKIWLDNAGGVIDEISLPALAVPMRTDYLFYYQSDIKSQYDENDNEVLYRGNDTLNNIGEAKLSFWLSKGFLITGKGHKYLELLDFETLQPIWSAEFSGRSRAKNAGDAGGVFEYNDTLFLTTDMDGKQGVSALSQLDGAIQWQYVSEGVISSFTQYKDKLCVLSDCKLVQLDARSGTVEFEIDTGLTDQKNVHYERDDAYLYCISTISKKVQIFSASSHELLHEFDIPKQYSPMHLYPVGVCPNGLYIPLVCARSGPKDAMLVISREELDSGKPLKLEYEATPDIKIDCISDPEGLEHYEISISGTDLALVQRYFEVSALELLADVANQPFPSDKMNAKFNGKVMIKVDRAPLGDVTEDDFDYLLDRLYAETQPYRLHGGPKAGLDEIEYSWQWL